MFQRTSQFGRTSFNLMTSMFSALPVFSGSAGSWFSQMPSHASFSTITNTKNVVIIGGRSQIGETLRGRFSASGWNVICTTQGSGTHKLDDRGFHLEGNVNLGQSSSWVPLYWENLFTKIEKQHGSIHTVVNCAGISINDSKTGYTMEDVNRRPVGPMLQACIALGISRYTFISSQAAKYPGTHKPGSYSKSKIDAEQDIATIMSETPKTKTQATIMRCDWFASARNPSHFGSPQRLSMFPLVKLTVGEDPSKAGSTILQPVIDYDVADAVINVSDFNVSTPRPIDACGPEIFSIEDLMSFFKERQHKHYIIGIKIPSAAIAPATVICPRGALEPDHLDLIKHHEENPVERVDTSEFEKIVALSRPGQEKPLMSLAEAFEYTKRPVYGTHDLGLYAVSLLSHVKMQHLPALCKGAVIGITQSRIDFRPHRKTAERRSCDGVNTGLLLVGFFGTSLATRLYQEAKRKEPVEELQAPVLK